MRAAVGTPRGHGGSRGRRAGAHCREPVATATGREPGLQPPRAPASTRQWQSPQPGPGWASLGPGGRHRCGPAPSARPGTRRAGKRRHTQLDAINKTFIPTTVAQGTNQIKKKKKRKGNRKNVVSSFRLRASCAVCAHARPLSAESLGLRTRRGGSLTPVRIPARLFPECRTVCVLSGSSRARPATP